MYPLLLGHFRDDIDGQGRRDLIGQLYWDHEAAQLLQWMLHANFSFVQFDALFGKGFRDVLSGH